MASALRISWRFSSRDKMDGDRVLRNFFDGVTLSRRYLWGVSNLSFKEKGFLEFLLFSIFFCFFLLLEKIREWKRLDYFGEMLDGITHLLGFIKVQDRRFHKHRLTYSIKEDFDDNGGAKIGRIENWLVPI